MSDPKKDNQSPWAEIILTVVVPAIILSKLSAPERLGVTQAFGLALAFPLFYSLWRLVRERKFSLFAILGFVNVLLTGGLGFLKAEGIWFAVKEATVPTLLGCAVLFSQRTDKPLVRSMLYNDKILNLETVSQALSQRQKESDFEKLLRSTAYILATSFFLSAVLNFGLAVALLKSPAGTPEFNAELGRMTALSYPVIMVPSMAVLLFALWRLSSGIQKLTGLELEHILKSKG